MARIIDSSGSSDELFATSSHVTAGESINQDDLLNFCGLSGKAFAVDVADYAAVGDVTYGTDQATSGQGRVFGPTTIVAATDARSKQAIVKNNKGYLFALTCDNSNVGAQIGKYSAIGIPQHIKTIEPTGITYNHHILELSNGNIVVIYSTISPYELKFAIYDPRKLDAIKTLTVIATLTSITPHYFSCVTLSGGGFAVVYQDGATPLTSKMATFDNFGNAVLAPITIWTRTGTTGQQFHKIKQLSNGNIAYSISSINTVSSIGLYYGVVTSAGVEILAPTQLDSVSAAWFPELAICTGYFAIARANGTDQKAWIFNNAGVIQGSAFSQATTAGNANHKNKLLWNGSDFNLIWHRNLDSKCLITKLPFTGANYTTVDVTTGDSTTQYNKPLDAFCEDGYIVAVSMVGQPEMWVADVASQSLVSEKLTGPGVGAAGSSVAGDQMTVIPGGDRTFITMYDYVSGDNNKINIYAGKWSTTSIVGVSMSSAAKDSSVAIQSEPGFYEINPIKGSDSKSFDMRTGKIAGNKGVMAASGAVTLYGIGTGA